MITYGLSKTNNELKQILVLQQANLPVGLTSEEKNREGFVTVHHDFHILKRMHDVFPHIIVKDGNDLIGYALSMHPQFGNEIEVLKPMFKEIQESELSTSKFIVMGQICISKAFRKKGVFRKLYATMAKETAKAFNYIITEVDAENQRSLQAHLAIGFKQLKSYSSAGRTWELIFLATEPYR